MDPTLWSRLPQEILGLIIENTADSETQECWREATKHWPYYHRVAIRTSYSTFTICEIDLLRAPKVIRHGDWYTSFGNDEASGGTPRGAERPKRQLIHDLRTLSYQNVAPSVRRLVLQFYFASSNRLDHLVRSEDVRHTLDTILPQAKSLQEIDHHGVLYQEELDGILAVRSLKLLRVRQSWNETPCSCSEGESPRPIRLLALDWSRLPHLHALKTLSISQLHTYEAVGLARAVKRLRKLESLRLETAKIDILDADIFSDDGDDNEPLMTFIGELYRRKKKILERGCRVSILVESSGSCGHIDISRLPKNLISPVPNLRELYLDLLDSEEITNFFAFLNPYGLVKLLVSAYPKPEKSRICSIYKASHHCDVFRGLLGQNSNTLREIILLDAWQDTRENGKDIEPPWVSEMPLQQIYISKPSRRSGSAIHSRPHVLDKMTWRTRGGLRSGDMYCKIWGKGVRHMRIDQLDLAKLKISVIDQSLDKFRQLKILVLRYLPEQVRYRPTRKVSQYSAYMYDPTGDSVLRSTPYPYLPLGPTLPKDLGDLREGQMAMKIATQDLPSLCVIAVGEYRFWLQRGAEEDDHLNRRPKVWFLRHALQCPGQEAVIMQTMNRDDWDFLADREDCLPEKAPKEQEHWANRLVYRPRVKKVVG